MRDESDERSEYTKFLILVSFFGLLMLGAALLRPVILGRQQKAGSTVQATVSPIAPTRTPPPTPTPTSTSNPMPTTVPVFTPTPTAAPTETPAATPTPLTYVVQPGDNLFRIGQRFGLTVPQLADLNGLVNPNLIHAGQILRVQVRPAEPSAEAAAGRTYLVRDGDTLWKISRAACVDLEALVAANRIDDPNLIRPGMVLTIPD